LLLDRRDIVLLGVLFNCIHNFTLSKKD